jgi:signal transduction histidine kinase/ActR/RegA family two-component response regulator
VLYRLRLVDTPMLLTMSAVAAAGASLWLGLGFGLTWLGAIVALTGLDRLVCWLLCRGPWTSDAQRRAAEAGVAVDTLVYTLVYCILPVALVAHGGHVSMVAGVSMLGAIAVSGVTEFVVSRLVGAAAMAGLVLMSLVGALWGVHLREWPSVVFALFAMLAFFGYVLDLGLRGDRIERRTAAALAVAKAKEAEAAAANAAKSSFLATMSHEIRTPLNGVLGMAQAMEADALSPAQRARLTVIRNAGQTLLAILNDVLDLSKIEAGKLDLEAIEFDIEAVLAGVEAAFAPLAAAKGLALVTEVAPAGAGAYLGDPTRLRQILYNLVSNAVKFTDEGQVTIRADRDGDGLRVVVADTGVGVPADQMDGLFVKFTQADAAIARRHGGTGLGLAICRELAELMGGRIRAESELGRGSRFSLELPLPWIGAARPPPAAQAEGAAPTRLSLRLLAAEDNPVNQLVLKALLSQIGLDPTVVENGEQAIAAWEDGDWAVILMDVQMPVMDGVTAAREIRRREAALGRARTPIIALTANAMAHQAAEYAAAGMDGHVSKPIDIARLFAAIEAALASAEAAQRSAA